MNNANMETEVIVSNDTTTGNSSNISDNQNEINELTLAFVSMVSHEFRSPLTTIQSSTEILESFSDRLSAEEKEKHFQTVYNSLSNLSELHIFSLYIGSETFVHPGQGSIKQTIGFGL